MSHQIYYIFCTSSTKLESILPTTHIQPMYCLFFPYSRILAFALCNHYSRQKYYWPAECKLQHGLVMATCMCICHSARYKAVKSPREKRWGRVDTAYTNSTEIVGHLDFLVKMSLT